MINNKISKLMLFVLLGNVLISSPHAAVMSNDKFAVVASEVSDGKPNLAKEYENLKTQSTSVVEKFFSVLGHRVVNAKNSPELHKVVTDLCAQLNMPVPYVTVFKGNIINSGLSKVVGLDFKANAFATSLIQRLGLISVGSDLIEQLSYDEIRSVIAHELGHIKCYHIIKKIGLSLVVSNALSKAMRLAMDKTLPNPDSFEKNPDFKTACLVLSYVATYSLTENLINAKASRMFEKEADLKALSLTHDKNGLINALNGVHKIAHEIFDKSLLAKTVALFNSHPSNKERAEYLTLESAKLNIA